MNMSVKLILTTGLLIICLPQLEGHVKMKRNKKTTSRQINSCKVNKTVADCSHQGLFEIPTTLPSTITVLLMNDNNLTRLQPNGLSKFQNLTHLDISNNKIQHASNDSFKGLKHLKKLHMSSCKLLNIDSGAFLPLRNIEELDISDNKMLHFGNFQNATYGLINSSIQVLKASGIVKRWSVCNILNTNHTQHLKNTRLKKLYFDHNRLEGLRYGTLLNLPETLWFLSVRYSRFTNGPYISMLAEMTNVTHLYMGNENSETFPYLPFLQNTKGVDSRFIKHPRDEDNIFYDSSSYNIHHSDIQQYLEYKSELLPPLTQQKHNYKTIIFLPPNLQVLQITCKRLDFDITLLSFSSNNISTLILRCNLLSNWIGPVEGLEHLETLDLSDNLARSVSTFFFSSFPQLKVLNMSFNFIGSMIRRDSRSLIFDNLTSLEVLDMSLNTLHSLPENIFRDLVSLKVLNLSTNKIYLNLPLRVAHMKNLQFWDLSNNQIRWFSETLMQDLDILAESSNISIRMLLNPITCTCDNLSFLRWMRTSKVIFLNVTNYTCAFEDKTFAKIGTFEDTVNRLQNECKSITALVLGSVLGFLILCTILGGVVAYRCRWNLRYWYYAARLKHQNQSLLNSEDDLYKFDAFVSYAEEDEHFVVNDMRNRVEDLAGMKLNIKDRDFVSGQIPSNILSAIKTSRKTVVVLSKSFLDNNLCQYEIQMANIESIKNTKNMLIIIMYEDISITEIPVEVRYRLRTESYIHYPHDGDEARIDLFWRRFIRALQDK